MILKATNQHSIYASLMDMSMLQLYEISGMMRGICQQH